MAPTITRWPTLVLGFEPVAERLDDADGLVPEHEPVATGYSPLTMCTSVPQMVVVVTRMTACPAFGIGFGRSSMTRELMPRNATAFMVLIDVSLSMNVALCACGSDARWGASKRSGWH